MDFQGKLESLEASFRAPLDEEFAYYHLWRQIPNEYRVQMGGTNRPKTRDEIVQAVARIDADRKRDRSKADVDKPPEGRNKRQKRNDRSPSRQRYGRGKTQGDKSKGTDKDKDKDSAAKGGWRGSSNLCFNCGKPGHRAADCRSKKNSSAAASSARVATASTATGSGKVKASRTSSPDLGCKKKEL